MSAWTSEWTESVARYSDEEQMRFAPILLCCFTLATLKVHPQTCFPIFILFSSSFRHTSLSHSRPHLTPHHHRRMGCSLSHSVSTWAHQSQAEPKLHRHCSLLHHNHWWLQCNLIRSFQRFQSHLSSNVWRTEHTKIHKNYANPQLVFLLFFSFLFLIQFLLQFFLFTIIWKHKLNKVIILLQCFTLLNTLLPFFFLSLQIKM